MIIIITLKGVNNNTNIQMKSYCRLSVYTDKTINHIISKFIKRSQKEYRN